MDLTTKTPQFVKSDEEDQFQKLSSTVSHVSTNRKTRRVSIKDPANKEIIHSSRSSSVDILFKNVDQLSKREFKNDELIKDANSSTTLKNNFVADQKLSNNSKNEKYVDDEKTLSKITDLSPNPARVKFSVSQNIGVLSMSLDVPCSEPLPPLEAAAISCVLQECLDILKILEYTIPAKVDERWDYSYKSMREKYGNLQETENIFQEDMGLLPLIPTAAEKLQKERTYVYKILEEILNNIKENKSFDRLKIEVDNIVKTVENERDLQVDYEIWPDLVNQLKDSIDIQKIRNEEELKTATKLALKTDVEADNSIFLNDSKLEYVKRWEQDRLNQQNLKLEQEEEKIINELNKIGKMERAEQIISEDLQTYLQDNIAEMENEITEWTNKYDEEIKRRQMEIYDLKESIEELKENLQELYNLRDDRQAFIDECYEEKARIKKEEEHRKILNKAATIIQSFWRGHMVRNQIGEYQSLWVKLRKRKKRAAILKKKRQAWQKKKEKQWGETKLKTMKNIIDPNA